jgi:hypothetical protein
MEYNVLSLSWKSPLLRGLRNIGNKLNTIHDYRYESDIIISINIIIQVMMQIIAILSILLISTECIHLSLQ